jgi:hypothetical protein
VLIELAAANAAYAVIKECVQNSGELIQAGKAVMDWFNAKNSLQKKIEEKPPDQRSDLEEFFALEELKKQQQELKELMIYKGRPGLWDDWLAFQVKARQKRDDAERAKIKQEFDKQKKWDVFIEKLLLVFWLGALVVVFIFIVGAAIWLSMEIK